MSHQDHKQNQDFEKKVQDAFEEVSSETTSSALDQSILAMAEKHHQVEKLGFWNRFFRSKQLKYLASMSAALVMTVGIARFMVYLGKTDQSSAQNTDLAADTRSVDEFSFEMADEVAAAPVARESYTAKKQKAEVPELVTNQEMRQILKESELLAKNEQEQKARLAASEKALAEDNVVVVTGSRIRAEDLEETKDKLAEKELSRHGGVLDEAIDDAPKPEAWLNEIMQLLKDGEKAQAQEEWSQFKNTYPLYEFDEALTSKLKKAGLID